MVLAVVEQALLLAQPVTEPQPASEVGVQLGIELKEEAVRTGAAGVCAESIINHRPFGLCAAVEPVILLVEKERVRRDDIWQIKRLRWRSQRAHQTNANEWQCLSDVLSC